MSFDIFNPQVSVVAKGLEGKVITIYGSNNLGKTKQATRMKKPFYLGFEKGIRAISGVPFLPINKWSDFKKINKQLTDPKNLEKARELYQTIIFDEVYTSALYCQDYLCKKHGVEAIGEGNNGYGLWKEYESEYWTELDKLINSGYTLAFISHQEETKEGKAIPKGDKRSIKPIIDNSDIVVYLTSNGVDEDRNVIKSSAWFAETDEFFARSRFDYIDTYLETFTAENLERVIAEAIERQEEAEGITAVTYGEQKESFKSEALNFDELVEQINEMGSKIMEEDEDKLEEVVGVIEKHLGKGKKVSDAKKTQVEVLSVILEDLKDLI
ncbi:ATP-binding protein [Bacillus infantis]|uniref:ATP-binding protein n=1 Tax=Bacillus infantis TaxID=324767 RepID=UPI00209F78A6|nr:ATP-binding protein [Bacillus infantis]MCP1159295.1 ATP-binding protein [Bacillus infantis]